MRKSKRTGFEAYRCRAGGAAVILLMFAFLVAGCTSETPEAVSQAPVGTTATPAPTHTPLATHMPYPTPTATTAPTDAPRPTATAAPTDTPRPTATATPTPTAIPTPEPTLAPAERERAALIALYEATAGSDWTDSTGWLSDAPVGEWHGVTIDDDGLVTQVALLE